MGGTTEDKKPRIDILVSEGGRGGVENVVNQAALYLIQQGFGVRILQFAGSKTQWVDERIEHTSFWPVGKRIEFDETIDMIIDHYRNKGTPNLLLATTWPALNTVAAIVRAEVGADFSIGSWMHASLEKYESFGWGGPKELINADFHLAINRDIADEIRRVMPLAKIYEINNPVAPDRICYSPKRDPSRFCVVTRLDKLKNTDQVVRAAASIGSVIRLDIVGSGDEFDNLNALIDELGVRDRTVLHGWNEKPWELLKDAGTLVVASEEETGPLVAAEALLSGKAVIASDIGAVPKWAEEGKKIFTFENRDFKTMERLMKDIAEGSLILPTSEECRASAADLSDDKPLESLCRILKTWLRG